MRAAYLETASRLRGLTNHDKRKALRKLGPLVEEVKHELGTFGVG